MFQGAKKIPPKVIEKILRENAMVPQTKFWEVFADFPKTLEALIRILWKKAQIRITYPFYGALVCLF